MILSPVFLQSVQVKASSERIERGTDIFNNIMPSYIQACIKYPFTQPKLSNIIYRKCV